MLIRNLCSTKVFLSKFLIYSPFAVYPAAIAWIVLVECIRAVVLIIWTRMTAELFSCPKTSLSKTEKWCKRVCHQGELEVLAAGWWERGWILLWQIDHRKCPHQLDRWPCHWLSVRDMTWPFDIKTLTSPKGTQREEWPFQQLITVKTSLFLEQQQYCSKTNLKNWNHIRVKSKSESDHSFAVTLSLRAENVPKY